MDPHGCSVRSCAARCSSAPPMASERRPWRCSCSPTRRADKDPFAPKKPHFAPKAKSVIFLFMDGGPSQVDTFDPKPLLEKYHGKPFPTKVEPTQFNNVGNTLASPVEVPASTARAACRSATCSRTSRKCVDDLVRDPLDGRELLRAHERQLLPPQRQRPAGPAEHGGVGDLRPRQRVPRPARLRRPQQRHDPARRHRLLRQRLPAGRVSGVALPQRRAPGRRPHPARRRDRQDPRRQARPAPQARRRRPRSGSATATPSTRPSPTTNSPFRMQTAVPELDRPLEGDREDASNLYGLDDPKTEIFGRQCLHRPADGREGRAVRRTAVPEPRPRPLGPALEPEEGARGQRPRRRQADRGPADGPEAARPARRTRW